MGLQRLVVGVLPEEGATAKVAGHYALPSVPAVGLGGELVDVSGLEDFGEVEGRQRGDLVVWDRDEQVPNAAEGDLVDDVLRQRVAPVCRQALLAGRPDMNRVVVEQGNGVAELLHVPGHRAHPGRRPHEEEAVRVRLGQVEPPGEGGQREAVDGHRADDHGKDDRHHPVHRSRVDGAQLVRKERGHGRGHDAPRGQPRQERLFLPLQVRPEGGDEDGERAHDHDQNAQEDEHPQVDVLQGAHLQPGAQKHKERPDKQHLQVLFELDNALHGHVRLVRQGDAHERRGEQAGLVLQHIGDDEGHDHHHQGNRVPEKVGNHAPPQDHHEQHGGHHADAQGHEDLEAEPDRDVLGGGRGAGARPRRVVHQNQGLEDQHGQNGPHRVDRDALPLGNGADAAFGPDVAQKGDDDRRPRHCQDGPDEHGQPHIELQDVVGPGRPEAPREQHPDRDEVEDRTAHLPQLGEPEAQPALEQNNSDGQGDEGEQPVPTKRLRVENAQNWAGQKPTRSSRRIEGNRNRHAAHCAPMPSMTTTVMLRRMDSGTA